ncbi:MAG: FAD-binding oxidoreductase [Candidatus Neomarinimicrobiota bacterium]
MSAPANGARQQPGNRAAVADLIRQARTEGWSIGSPAADRQWDLSRLQQVALFNPADMLLTVETGLSLQALKRIAAAENLWLPLDSPVPDLPLAELLARDASLSWLSHCHGLARDWVMSLTALDDQGRAVYSGAKVVKNVAGYQLAPLYIGARHSLGPVMEVSFRLRPQPLSLTTVSLEAADPEPLLRLWTPSRSGERAASHGTLWEALLIERRAGQWRLRGFTSAPREHTLGWIDAAGNGKQVDIDVVKQPPDEADQDVVETSILLQVLPSQIPDLLDALVPAGIDLTCYPSSGAVLLVPVADSIGDQRFREALRFTQAWSGRVRPLSLEGAATLSELGIRERPPAVMRRVKQILDPDTIFGPWPEELW